MAGVSWDALLDFAYLSLFLLIATVLRSRISFLQKLLIPNSILAGVLAIVFGQYLFQLFDPDQMGTYVYHLLTLSFIAVGLRGSKAKHSYGTITTSIAGSVGIAFQGLIGLVFTLIAILTYYPDLFPTFGIQLVMGFANNPGVAYSFGKGWEAVGFVEGGQVGLAFGAIGFLWAYIVGMVLVNWGIRRNKGVLCKGYQDMPRYVFTGIRGKDEPGEEAGKLTTASEAIESTTLHISMIGVVFLVTYYFMIHGLGLLHSLGGLASELAAALEGFSFIFGIVFAFITRKLMNKFKVTHVIDNGIMTRLGGMFLDLMIVTAVAAISIHAISAYWLEIAVLSTIGGLLTIVTVFYLNYKMHRDHHFERAITGFGGLTGTITSGLALLRVLDPNLETPVAIDRIYSGGIIIFLSLPILVCANIPVVYHLQDKTIHGLLLSSGIVVVYIAVMLSVWKIYQVLYLRRLARDSSEQAGA